MQHHAGAAGFSAHQRSEGRAGMRGELLELQVQLGAGGAQLALLVPAAAEERANPLGHVVGEGRTRIL